jgi:hypothetical protein
VTTLEELCSMEIVGCLERGIENFHNYNLIFTMCIEIFGGDNRLSYIKSIQRNIDLVGAMTLAVSP